jgi:isopenicillin-N N-acyltransferase-like protein
VVWEDGGREAPSYPIAIQQNVKAYLRLIEFHAGLGHGAALEVASTFEPVIKTHTPGLLLEMQGIADGAGCDLSNILLVNARSELMSRADECTALAATSGATSQGQVLLGQNWDWYTSIEDEPILLRIRQPNKPEILTLAEAGQVAKIGLNSAGLGVCLHDPGFISTQDVSGCRPALPRGVPVHRLQLSLLR